MEEKLNVVLISESEGEYKCALVNEEGEEKYKFTVELSEADLDAITGGVIYMNRKITKDTLYQTLKKEIAVLIMEECGKFSKYIDYNSLCSYDNFAPGSIALSLSEWTEQRAYDYFNDVYSPDDKQIEEMKKFYEEGIDLNLAIKCNEEKSFFGSMLSAEEMRKVRIAKEKEWMDIREGRKGFNGFKEDLKFEGTIVPHIEKEDNENACQKSGKEIFED